MKLLQRRNILLALLFLLPNFAQAEVLDEAVEFSWTAAIPSPSPAPNIVVLPIPQPSGAIVKVSSIKAEKELGKKINLADKMIGEREGSIVVDLVGAIETPLHITSNHKLYFSAGTYSLSV